ncbi:MAG: hypothetical protein A2277_20035 [Desulfobacterales bacterium RIFOXYA12_FULL_46_15]|nr:MAG: hypothetical protein A2097_04955 [Desulfobacula sp. GWF2_41_7]OGR22248.1 MAG: hypothetical protein A2277_20035 [Desulfobacterales bacterium RIFOXYA12_FULL_46_15]
MKKAIFLCVILLLFSFSRVFSNDLLKLKYITEEYKPYNFVENGEIKGIAPDLLGLAWKEMNIEKQEIKVLPWARGYDMLQNNPYTVLFATARSDERENQFKWACPITTNHYVVLAKKDRKIKISSVEDINKYRIGTIREDIAEQLLIAKGLNAARFDRGHDIKSNVRKLDVGRIDLMAYGKLSAFKTMKDMGIDLNRYESVYEIQSSQICYAFNIQTPDEVVSQFQNALDKIVNSPEYQKLLDKYFY